MKMCPGAEAPGTFHKYLRKGSLTSGIVIPAETMDGTPLLMVQMAGKIDTKIVYCIKML
jgi:hypothetical protein